MDFSLFRYVNTAECFVLRFQHTPAIAPDQSFDRQFAVDSRHHNIAALRLKRAVNNQYIAVMNTGTGH